MHLQKHHGEPSWVRDTATTHHPNPSELKRATSQHPSAGRSFTSIIYSPQKPKKMNLMARFKPAAQHPTSSALPLPLRAWRGLREGGCSAFTAFIVFVGACTGPSSSSANGISHDSTMSEIDTLLLIRFMLLSDFMPPSGFAAFAAGKGSNDALSSAMLSSLEGTFWSVPSNRGKRGFALALMKDAGNSGRAEKLALRLCFNLSSVTMGAHLVREISTLQAVVMVTVFACN